MGNAASVGGGTMDGGLGGGTPLSEVTVQVECPACSPGREDDDLQRGSIKLRCRACQSEFFEASKENGDPMRNVMWEHLSAAPLVSGYCFACDKESQGELFCRCTACKSPAALMDKCSICWENCDVMNEMTALDVCGHRFCNTCWSDHCSTAIRQLSLVAHPRSGFYTVQCPYANCSELPADPHFIKQFVAAELYDRMKSYAVENFAQLKLGAVTCPMRSCGSVMIPNSRGNPKVTCIDCNTVFCSRCKSEWHRHQTCEQFQGTRYDVDANHDQGVLGITVKQCPNPSCPMMIEKEEGSCNYMKCSYCQHVFCWVCLKPWPSDPSFLGDRIVLPLHAFNIQKPCQCPKWADRPRPSDA